jgi:hypothetical protein
MALATGAGAEPGSVPAPTFQVGDTWVYDRTHLAGKGHVSRERVVERVDRVDSDEMLMGLEVNGASGDFEDHRMGLDLSQRAVVDGQEITTERLFVFPLKIGTTWQEDFVDPRRQGVQTSAHVQKTYRVTGWEDVVTPAGTFHALKIEARGRLTAQVTLPAVASSAATSSAGGGTSVSHARRARSGTVVQPTYRVLYYVPAIKTYVKILYEQYDDQNVLTKRDTGELVSFKPGA